jgi:hypothetical protein
MSESLSTRVKCLKKQLDRRMARSEIRYARFEEQKNILIRLESSPNSLATQVTD